MERELKIGGLASAAGVSRSVIILKSHIPLAAGRDGGKKAPKGQKGEE